MAKPNPTLREGLSVVRFATPDSIATILDKLNDEYGHMPTHVQLATFSDEAPMRRPNVHLLESEEVKSHRLPAVPLTTILGTIATEFPRLARPTSGVFLDSRVTDTQEGWQISLAPEQATMNNFNGERAGLTDIIERSVGFPIDSLYWPGGHPDLIIAQAGPDADPSVLAEVADFMRTFLPIRVEFDGVEFFPDPRFD